MSAAATFSDFGPLTERRRVEKQRQQRRRVMIAAGGASVVLILIVMGGAAVAYNASVQDDSDSSSSSSPSSPSGGGSGSSLHSVSKSVKMMCAQTDYKDACEKSLSKAAANASASSPKDIVRAAVAVIGDAVGKAFDRSALATSDNPRVKAAVADCKEIYQNARDDLARTLRGIDAGGMDEVTRRGYELRVWLSAVIAHMETCIDGFPDGDLKKNMTDAMESGKELTSNALAIIEKTSSFLAALQITGAAASHRRLFSVHEDEGVKKKPKVNYSGAFHGVRDDSPAPESSRRRLLSIEEDTPPWVNGQERRLLKGNNFQGRLTPNVVVAKDGSGKFKTINDALNAMPKTYTGRYLIYVKQGVYEEYVTITRAMENVTMYGDGAMKTIITGSRNFADGLTTYKTATFNAQGDGFIAIALGFRNTAGAAKHQAVALLVQSDRSIFLNCRMDAYQDTLYAHSKAQFYRNCVISGTIDFVFGDAAAVFQNCILVLRRPMDNQQNIATAQGRADGRESTGFVFQYCRLTAESALKDASRPAIRSYLARPWREFSRTLIMESEIPAFIDKAGYLPWSGDFGLKTLWYAEYANRGPGADTAGRVAWPGYKKVISKEEAAQFTVQNFLHAEPWLKPAGAPVKYGFWA
ncbi:putative pectinesterase/pectinesterase inhibitor 13 [Dichanthelium oligosanthes]|uniref:Pectinesterase n=1 Tax=Dichanthelium oligosanthes TaxID=888268 RepID=A0A1E5USV6_9POAL|nr:putative pectinesterase/pectinesterase inhibitor 13 [Dichanthelium oligosanthes]